MHNELLRHCLATISYRFRKAVHGQDGDFGDFQLGKGSRSSNEIVRHMFQVIDWTVSFVREEKIERGAPDALGFTGEVERFLDVLRKLDACFEAVDLPLPYAKKLLQGPLSDTLTHVGQIAMLSRLHGKPIQGEDFSAAEIVTGEI